MLQNTKQRSLALTVFTFLVFSAPNLTHAETIAANPPRTIEITGEGTVSAAADSAIMSLAVASEAPSAAAASQANAKAATQIMERLKQEGIAKADIQTNNYSLDAVYSGEKTPRLTGYRASNSLNIRIRSLEKTGQVIDTLLAQGGANRIDNLRFEKMDASAQLEESRKLAIRSALAKAKLYAQEAGEELGPILSIRENTMPSHQPRMMATMDMAARGMMAQTPIEAGDLTWSTRVEIVVSLKKK
jgi:uncharacterized protein